MNSLSYFFRGQPDGIYFKSYGSAHFVLLFIAIIGSYLIYSKRRLLREQAFYKPFKFSLACILLSQQIILYLWYIFTGYSNISESLPLYNCRIAIFFTAFALLFNKNVFKNIALYWGMYGSILALFVIEGDPFSFPHYTMVSYFVGHIFLLWSVLFILVVEKYELNKENLKFILKLQLSIIYFC